MRPSWAPQKSAKKKAGFFLVEFLLKTSIIIAFLVQIRNIAFQGGPEMASWRPTLRHSFERELDYGSQDGVLEANFKAQLRTRARL